MEVTKEEFILRIKSAADLAQKKYPGLREGQAIFNATEDLFNVARFAQFKLDVDCFYNNELIDKFLDACWDIYSTFETLKEKYAS